jgi:hypothetical protein
MVEAMATQANEVWLPRCFECGESKLILAPANGFTKFIVDKLEIYCFGCGWRGMLTDNIKKIFVRS